MSKSRYPRPAASNMSDSDNDNAIQALDYYDPRSEENREQAVRNMVVDADGSEFFAHVGGVLHAAGGASAVPSSGQQQQA